jgi:hypothetical protein
MSKVQLKEWQVREAVRKMLSEAFTFNKPPGAGPADYFINRRRDELKRWEELRGDKDFRKYHRHLSDEEYQKVIDREMESTRADMEDARNLRGKYEPVTGYGDYSKRIFDQNCEVARTGYRVRRHVHDGSPAMGMFPRWDRRSEVPCTIFTTTPLGGYSNVLLLLRGGRVTYADFSDVVSQSHITPSGLRQYPEESFAKPNAEGKISITWDDVDQYMRENDLYSEYQRVPCIEEALVVGSFPEAIIINNILPASARFQYTPEQLDITMTKIEATDLPMKDSWLRPLTLERVRRILGNEED